ncbi:twin-arginine translocase subunit TatC [Desulfofundulus thermosubterraneus]|uniref:Sec-independent protein translocase protein TatC n=1 Tax=Desulfofundulus thermosubterraneus DSM 16057 TaxID=1121432 RepID=A0A1M6B006_9FIRM|nr:twin-arginine translocase subunit TatC [Desulfofundulus thermosubterraneus]SHI42042.1 Sec-independent protein translocase TatC [Desulfofundulus thermosubterraneus DSM 16057]
MDGKTMSLAGHLGELRRVVIVSTIALIACAIIAFFTFGDQLLAFLTRPLKELGVPVIATRVGEAFITKIKVSLLAGFILAFPVMVWQVLGFILPALNRGERRLLLVLFPLSVTLFATGVAFAYFTVFPLTVRFLLILVTEGLQPMITVRDYLSFVLAFFIPFGLVFQLPLAVFVLTRMGLVTPRWLVKKRKYALLVNFILAAILTPGSDVISQLMMAMPMVLLYEAGVLVSYLVYRLSRSKMNKVSMVESNT